MNERSREGLARGQQLYAAIEFCSSAETLWGKIASGNWDWLGVRRSANGRLSYVVGSPPTSKGFQSRAVGIVSEVGVSEHHRTTIQTPDLPEPGPPRHYASAAAAAAGFDEIIRLFEMENGSSGLILVRLYEGDTVTRSRLVVRARPNEL